MKELGAQTAAHLLGNNLLEVAHNTVGDFLRKPLASIVAQAFWGTVLLEELAGVYAQHLCNLVYDGRRGKGVTSFDTVDVVVALVQVDGQVLLGQSPFLAEVTQVGDEGLL